MHVSDKHQGFPYYTSSTLCQTLHGHCLKDLLASRSLEQAKNQTYIFGFETHYFLWPHRMFCYYIPFLKRNKQLFLLQQSVISTTTLLLFYTAGTKHCERLLTT